ncbi:hypothetical protein VU06_00120 [Desulfobulbus sp. F3]|nr:hypothetical protein [Desulfobulbus sp. F3]
MNEAKIGSVKFSLRDILFILLFRIHITIGIPVVVVSVMLVYAISAKPVYVASANILLKPFFDSTRSLAGGYLNVFPVTQLDINTEIEILNSRELASEVVQAIRKKKFAQAVKKNHIRLRKQRIPIKISPMSLKLNLPDKDINYITGGLVISSVTTSSAIRIQKVGSDPEEIADIVNMYVDCYIKRHIEIHKSRMEMGFYEQGLQEKKDALAKKQQELSEIIKKNDIINIENQNEYNLATLKTLNESLSEIKGQIEQKKKIISEAKKNNFNAITQEFRENQLLSHMESMYISLLQEKEKISSMYFEDSAEYSNSIRVINNIKEEIDKERKKILNGLIVELNSIAAKRKVIESDIYNLNRQSMELSLIAEEFDSKIKEIEQIKRVYNLYSDKLEEERIQKQRNEQGVSNISVISYAHKPSIPIAPKKKFILIVAIIAGSAAGIGTAFATYYLDRTVKEPKDIMMLIDAPVISSLGNIRSKK